MTNQEWNRDRDMDRDSSTDQGDDRSGWRGVTDQAPTGQGSTSHGDDEGVLGGESWQDPGRQSTGQDDETSSGDEQSRHDDLSRS